MLGNALCETLNGIRQNSNTVHVEKDILFWLTQSDCVWVEIVGVDKAQQYLLRNLATRPIHLMCMIKTENSYIATPIPIHYHWNQIRYWECQANITANISYADSERLPEEEQHVDEGSHSPIILDTDEEEQL